MRAPSPFQRLSKAAWARMRAALVAASKGDFSAFDAARAKLKRLRGEGEDNAVAPREDEKFE